MNPEQFAQFTRELEQRLAQDSGVLGLVALGSMSGQGAAADEWSDHDFFVVVASGQQERFRLELGWLPDAERIVLSLRETAHGLKVLYDDAHLLELAVFDLDELRLSRVNRYKVLLDRADVGRRLLEVARTTEREVRSAGSSDRWLAGMFLTNLLVGAGRYQRGERLSGRQFVFEHALGHLLRLLHRHVPAEHPEVLDNLDPRRRVERAWPEIGRALDDALGQTPVMAASRLLALARRELAGRTPDWPEPAAEAVARRLEAF